jgi:hypothetical protein
VGALTSSTTFSFKRRVNLKPLMTRNISIALGKNKLLFACCLFFLFFFNQEKQEMLSLCVHPEKKKKCFQKAIDELQENM